MATNKSCLSHGGSTLLSCNARFDGGIFRLGSVVVTSATDSEIARLSPVGTVRVSYLPELLAVFDSVANDCG